MARARNLMSRYDDEEEVIGTGGRETGQQRKNCKPPPVAAAHIGREFGGVGLGYSRFGNGTLYLGALDGDVVVLTPSSSSIRYSLYPFLLFGQYANLVMFVFLISVVSCSSAL